MLLLFNILVTLITLIAAGFLLTWWLRPDFRSWMEAPKYRFLDQERRFDDANAEKRDPPE